MMTKWTQELIIKAVLLCSVTGAGYYVGTQTDNQSSIAYARSVYMTTQSINLKSGMSSTKSTVAAIPSKQALNVLAVYDGGAWAKVTWNGHTGYIRTMYLKLTQVSDTGTQSGSTSTTTSAAGSSQLSGQSLQSDGYHMYAADTLSLRKSASTSATKLDTVRAGSDLLIIDKSGSFYKVLFNGRYGWVTASYVRDYAPGGKSSGTTSTKGTASTAVQVPSASATPGKAVRSDGYHMVTTSSVNLRSSASSTAKKLGTLPKGTDVLIIDRSGSYYKIYIGGRYSYVHSQYLGEYSGTATVASSGTSGGNAPSNANQGQSMRSDGYHMYARKQTVLKKTPSASASPRTTIAAGTDLLIIDQSGVWYKVLYTGAYSWVKKADLADYTGTASGGSGTGNSGSTTPSTGNGSSRPVSIMTTRKSVKLLAGPNKDFSSRGQLPAGTEVTVLNDWGYYVKVSYNGKDGYIHMADLKKAKGYQSPGQTGSSSQPAEPSGSGQSAQNQKPVNAVKSDHVKINNMTSYGDTTVKVSGTLSATKATRINVYLNGTFLNKASTDGTSYSYTIPATVTLPGSNKVRVEATTPLGILYQEETFTVNKIPTIVIDPGHGGRDPGAIGNHNGVQYLEKDYDLKFAMNLMNELKALGFDVKMTRMTDKALENSERVSITRQYGADLLFSLHHNAATAAASGGLTIYPSMKYNPSTQASFSESRQLAQMLETAYESAGMYYKGAYQDINISGHTLYIMRNAETRTILTEMGFITNAKDIKKITSPAFQADLPRRMAQQIYKFFYGR